MTRGLLGILVPLGSLALILIGVGVIVSHMIGSVNLP